MRTRVRRRFGRWNGPLPGWLFGAICLLGATATGCGERTSSLPVAELQGRITLDDKPLDQGTIIFQPQAAGMAAACTASFSAGQYQASQVPVGKVLVRIVSEKETGRMISGSSEPVPEVIDQVPPRYQQGIAIEVPAGSHTQDFPLTSRR